MREQFIGHEVGHKLRIPPRGSRLEIGGTLGVTRQHAGVIGGQSVLRLQAGALGIRKLRQGRLDLLHPGRVENQGQEVGIGEIAVVVRVLLGPHGAGLALAGVEQAGLLMDHAAVLENLHLTAGLIDDGLLDVAHGVHVLDLAAGAQRVPRFADGHVHVGAEIALFHVPVTGAEVAHQLAKGLHIGCRVLG